MSQIFREDQRTDDATAPGCGEASPLGENHVIYTDIKIDTLTLFMSLALT